MSLCLECGCGLCCDGTIYAFAPLKQEDFPLDPRFRIKPASGKAENKEDFFELPCSFCISDSCSIHDQERPAICGEYRCKLMIGYENGEVELSEARELIENIKQLRGRLKPWLEQFVAPDTGLSLNALAQLAVRKLDKLDPSARASVPPQMLLDIGMLRVILANRFDSRFTDHARHADEAKQAMNGSVTDLPVIDQ